MFSLVFSLSGFERKRSRSRERSRGLRRSHSKEKDRRRRRSREEEVERYDRHGKSRDKERKRRRSRSRDRWDLLQYFISGKIWFNNFVNRDHSERKRDKRDRSRSSRDKDRERKRDKERKERKPEFDIKIKEEPVDGELKLFLTLCYLKQGQLSQWEFRSYSEVIVYITFWENWALRYCSKSNYQGRWLYSSFAHMVVCNSNSNPINVSFLLKQYSFGISRFPQTILTTANKTTRNTLDKLSMKVGTNRNTDQRSKAMAATNTAKNIKLQRSRVSFQFLFPLRDLFLFVSCKYLIVTN